MSSNRAPIPEAKERPLEVIFQHVQYSLRIPTMHLINQFLNPGIKESKDEKKANIFLPIEERELKAVDPRPGLTKARAFERLIVSLTRVRRIKEERELKYFIQELIKKDLKQNISESEQIILSIFYLFDREYLDYKKAFNIVSREQLQQNAYAQSILGHLFMLGCGVAEVDYRRAWYCYENANRLKPGIFSNSIAFMLDSGHFVKQDQAAAMKEYLIAAERGCHTAMYNLAHYFANVKSPPDHKEAIKYFTAAHIHGGLYSVTRHPYLLVNEDEKLVQQVLMTEISSIHFTADQLAKWSSILLEEKYIQINIPQAIFCLRIALLNAAPNEVVMLNQQAENIFTHNLENAEVTYHYNMLRNDKKALHALLLNNGEVFKRLWYTDIDSPIAEIKQQAITQVVDFVPPEEKELVRLPQRLRANLAIYHFRQENDEGRKKAFFYLKGLGVTELTAEEKYQIGWLVFNVSIHPNTVLLKHGLLDVDRDVECERLFGAREEDEPSKVAKRFLELAAEAGHQEAKSFLATINEIDRRNNPAIFAGLGLELGPPPGLQQQKGYKKDAKAVTMPGTLFSPGKAGEAGDDKIDRKHTIQPPGSTSSSSAPRVRSLSCEDDSEDPKKPKPPTG